MIDYNIKYCELLNELCEKIKNSNADKHKKYVRRLGVMLKANAFTEKQKKDFIDILLQHYDKVDSLKIKNIFLNEIEILQKKIILKSKPRNIQVLLTNKCNLKCIMCEVFSKEYTVSEKLKSYLEENIPYLEQIMWQGGEVFLYNQFDKLMELAHKYNVNQNIVTNGLLMNEERIKKLSKYNLNLKISIDAVDKETYEQIRVGGKFETLVENLEILKKYKDAGANFKCELGAVIINKNYEKIDDIVNFAIKYGFENIIFQKYTPYRDKTLSLSDEQQIFVFNKIEMLKQKYETSTTNLRICSDIVLDTKEEKKNTEGNNKNLTENKDSYQNWNYHIDKNFIYDDVDTISVNKESSLFCFAPWSILYMLMNDEVAFSCRCKPIKSFEYENEDIWNCKKIQKYRENIIKNNLFECNICKGFGDNFKYSKYGML